MKRICVFFEKCIYLHAPTSKHPLRGATNAFVVSTGPEFVFFLKINLWPVDTNAVRAHVHTVILTLNIYDGRQVSVKKA